MKNFYNYLTKEWETKSPEQISAIIKADKRQKHLNRFGNNISRDFFGRPKYC